MSIFDLKKYMVLKEMCENNLNKRIDDKFYDNFMFEDTSWLAENKDKIINDFYSRDNTFERNNGCYPNINKFGYTNFELKEEKEYFKKLLKDL